LVFYHETLAELYNYFIPYPIEKLHTSNRDHIALVSALRAHNVDEAVEVSRKHVDILHWTMVMGLALGGDPQGRNTRHNAMSKIAYF